MAEDLETQMSREELIERARHARQEFVTLWSVMDVNQLTQRPGPQEDWSVKDLMAHIAWWEGYAVRRVAILLAGNDDLETPDFDAFNSKIFEEYKDLAISVVQKKFEKAFLDIEAQISKLSEEQLHSVSQYPTGGEALMNIYMDNTSRHYASHLRDLENYAARIK